MKSYNQLKCLRVKWIFDRRYCLIIIDKKRILKKQILRTKYEHSKKTKDKNNNYLKTYEHKLQFVQHVILLK